MDPRRSIAALAVILAGLAAMVMATASFAQAGPGSDETNGGGQATDKPPAEAAPPEEGPLPPELYDDFGFPDPDRPWGSPRYLDPRRHQPRYDDGRYSGYRRLYRDGYTYRYGVPYHDDGYAYDLERAYRQGMADGRNYERFEIQAERGLSAYRRAMVDGHGAFTQGEYGPAARHFLLAAALNQGDPAARLCAAHAQIALGNYDAAVRLLRRAFELQPRIAYLPIDLRKAYGKAGDFGKHLGAMHKALLADADDAQLHFLLGYYYFFSDDTAKAARLLDEALKLDRSDSLIRLLADVARLTAPTRQEPAPKRTSPRREQDL